MLTNGASFIGQMLKALIDLGDGEPPVWTNTAMEDLIVEDGRVVGARVNRDGSTLNIEARRGVLLAAGGFSRNADMRRRYSGDQPNEGKWSIANAGDTGEVLQTAMRPRREDRPARRGLVAANGFHRRTPAPASLGSGRQRPGAIYVDGDRQAVLQRVELLRRGRQGDVRHQGRAVLAGLRRGIRRPVRVGRQPAEEAHACPRS